MDNLDFEYNDAEIHDEKMRDLESRMLERRNRKQAQQMAKEQGKGTKVKASAYWLMLVFPLAMVYFECLFHIATLESFFAWSTFHLILFALAGGVVGYLIVTLFKKPKGVYISTIVLLALTAVPYLIEYFVHRQFKVYYDVNTIFNGANDVMDGFLGDIFRLIFCWDGLSKIFLFFLPAILYGIFGARLFWRAKATAKTRIIAIVCAGLVYCTGLVAVCTNEMAFGIYSKEYNYQAAVENFGLLTGIRLDVEKLLFGTGGDFEIPADDTVTEDPTEPTDEILPELPKEYGYNQLDLVAKLEGGSGDKKKLNEYVLSQAASKQNEMTGLFKGKNLIFLTAEAFSAEVISPELTPTLYRMATKGIQFTDYYQPASAGTTGGEYQNIFGMLPTSGGKSFKNAAKNYNYMTIASQLDRLGYYGKAYHNNSYKYYSRHETHTKIGYSDGYMGYGNGMEAYVTKAWPQSDAEMIQGTFPTYVDKQPFNIYYMTVSGHSAYTTSGNKQTKKHWDKVQHLPYSDPVKGYIAANLELEAAMAWLVGELEARGIANDTVICISTDHFPYGLDNDARLGDMPYLSELYGYNVTDYFQRDHSRLILWSGCLETMEPIVVDTPTFGLDVLPTLSNLFGTEFDSRLFVGRDVFSDAEPLVFNTNYDWKTDLGTYYNSKGKFIPKDENTVIPEDYVKTMKAIVRNKYKYCKMALDEDYFGYLFK